MIRKELRNRPQTHPSGDGCVRIQNLDEVDDERLERKMPADFLVSQFIDQT